MSERKPSVAELQRRFGRALLSRDVDASLDGTRAGTYRRLVRHNLDAVLGDLLPRTAALLGRRFWQEAALFYETRGPRTHYLRDVPGELLAWAEERWPHDGTMPAWALDLARYEVASHEASASPGDDETVATEALSLEAPVVMADHVRFLRMHHAAHEVSLDDDDRALPPAREVSLLVYRDDEHELRFLELTPAAAELVERLLAGVIVRVAIAEAAAAAGIAVDDAFLVSTSALLGDLAARGVLLGGAVASSAR